jgi:RNA polymerase sigma-70 factor (ECF subfamily)
MDPAASFDERMVAGMRRGEASAFRDFTDYWYDRLHRKALRDASANGFCPDDAFDVVQETMKRIFVGIGGLHDSEALEAWVWRIYNRAFTEFRKKKNRQWKREKNIDPDDIEAYDAMETARFIEQLDSSAKVEKVLSQLSGNDKELLLLHHGDGLAIEEMAELLDLPKSTIKQRLYRARQRAKDLLDE